MKRTYIIIFLFLILLLCRCFFIGKSEHITLYITLINSISFIIVKISIIEKSIKILKEEINSRAIPSQLKRNQIKDVNKTKILLYIFSLVAFFGLLFSSDVYNDVLSIFTIGISLLDNEIAIVLAKIVKRWCQI